MCQEMLGTYSNIFGSLYLKTMVGFQEVLPQNIQETL
jgi:hypothetical protein